MKLYYSPGACSLSPHIVAREAGLKLDLEKVDLGTGRTESGKALADITPKGYVPTLELDDGSHLTEGAVIVQYLADQAPSSGLLPQGGLARYRVQEWLNYIATEVHKGFSPLFASDSAEVKKFATDALQPKFAFLEEALRGKQHLLGDAFTVADAYLFTTLSWAGYLKIPLPTSLGDYLGRVGARPAVQAALKAEGLKA
ncbi:MAG: glutathione transferase GstA [Planctomycetes bacterium]|nr:glutathione transferase GstA [Planctomycetota bacterium]